MVRPARRGRSTDWVSTYTRALASYRSGIWYTKIQPPTAISPRDRDGVPAVAPCSLYETQNLVDYFMHFPYPPGMSASLNGTGAGT
jgi:hypothetical protein